MAIQRAEDKTAQLQARAGAIDELLASGALDDQSGMAKDDIQTELDRLSGGTDVELELQRMKAELAGGGSAASRPSRAAHGRHPGRRPRSRARASTSSDERQETFMIVRIMGEGQVKLADSHFTELNKLDDDLLAEMEAGDEDGFRRTLGALLDAVREPGRAAARRRPGAVRADPARPGRHPGRGQGHARATTA